MLPDIMYKKIKTNLKKKKKREREKDKNLITILLLFGIVTEFWHLMVQQMSVFSLFL